MQSERDALTAQSNKAANMTTQLKSGGTGRPACKRAELRPNDKSDTRGQKFARRGRWLPSWQEHERVRNELIGAATASLHEGFLWKHNPQLALVLLPSMPSGCPEVVQARGSILNSPRDLL